MGKQLCREIKPVFLGPESDVAAQNLADMVLTLGPLVLDTSMRDAARSWTYWMSENLTLAHADDIVTGAGSKPDALDKASALKEQRRVDRIEVVVRECCARCGESLVDLERLQVDPCICPL